MIIGVPKEIKNRENRVGLVPAGVRALVADGHTVLVEAGAGMGSGILDDAFRKAGAELVGSPKAVWNADMVIKVKEPLPQEYGMLRPGLILFTYLHLAAEKQLTEELLAKKVTSIAYETIQESDGSLPLLRPMSEVAGRLAVQIGAFYLQSNWAEGGKAKGVLLGGVPGVQPAHVTVLGAGVAGTNAVKMAVGLGARVTLLDRDIRRLEYLEDIFGGRVQTLMSNYDTIEESVANSDLLVGAVLVPGAKAPKLVPRETIRQMQPGSVVVDVSVDQGGCVETCKPTSHEDPIYTVDGVIHYCVTNMPGAVARTSTFALTNVTLRYALFIAEKGPEAAAKKYPAISKGFNTVDGKCVHEQVASAHGLPYHPLRF